MSRHQKKTKLRVKGKDKQKVEAASRLAQAAPASDIAIQLDAVQQEAPAAFPERRLDRFRWFIWLRKHPKVSGRGGIALAFAAILKALDWQIDGATKTAALALLLAWLVLSFSTYISSLWDKRRPWMIVFLIGAALAFTSVWWAYLPTEIRQIAQSSTEDPRPTVSPVHAETAAPPSPEQARSELSADSLRPIRDVGFGIKLNRRYSIQELGHFRVIFEIFNAEQLDFFLACQDLYKVNNFVSPAQMQFGYRCTTRYQKSNKQFATIPLYTSDPKYTSLLSGKSAVDHISWQIDLYNQIPSYKTLEDLNRKVLYIFVTAPLVDKISEVSFHVNNWELVSVKFDALKFIADYPIAPWFLPLTATEKSIEWRCVYLKWDAIEQGELTLIGDDYVAVFALDFSLIHPHKLPPPKFSPGLYP